ncbi:HGGxSTG domain-containing protein [Mycobacterium paraseoulense]|uniref:HGGxSTG domain-containing protein n=1 Tax=Mycobacterium paraseoulense TaxID=590652 RepID=UPI00114E644F|nr:HGGxSTG domain-containing protein [Mycobacterium paraseoulense]MCV7396021.1 hypothetical protein [Mycobacterium paraseoulense]
MTDAQKASRKRARALADLKATLEDDELNEDVLKSFGLTDSEIAQILGANAIDVEVVSVEESSGDRLPVVVHATTYQSSEPIEPQRDWPYGPVPERRCKAHKKTGEQCKNAAITGSTVCRFHGGAAKHVKMAARARLENAADRMAKHLLGLATDAQSENVQLAATNSALDRAGLKAPETVVLSAGQQSGFEEIFDDIATGTRAESRRARGIEDSDPNVSEPQSNYTPAPASPNSGVEYRQPNYGDYQQDSYSQNEYGIQSDKTPHGGPAPTVGDDGPIPRPSHQQRRERPPGAKWGPIVVGDDAIVLANATNAAIGALRELPPGRSSR